MSANCQEVVADLEQEIERLQAAIAVLEKYFGRTAAEAADSQLPIAKSRTAGKPSED